MPDRQAPVTDSHRLERLRRYAAFLDDGIRVPGTKFRFGFDPVLGLVPGLGDAIGAALSVAIVWEAVRQGVPRATLLKMAFNVALDAGLGSVPVIGDIFDALWKANRSNLELLDRSPGLERQQPAGAGGVFLLLAGLLVICLTIAIGIGWLGLRLLSWIAS